MPPHGFLAFCWHYTKPFWPLLLVSTLLSAVIAFLEVYLFAFLGKLVDLLTAANRASFWQDHGTQLMLMGAMALHPAAHPQLHLRVGVAPGPARQLCDAHPLGGAPLRAAPVDGLLHQRLRRPRRHQGDADGARRARRGDEVHRGAGLCRGLFRRRADPRGHRRPLADDPAAHLAGGLCRGLLVLRAPLGKLSQVQAETALAGHRPRRRQLHQHSHRQALRPCRPRGRLCPRGHGLDAEVGERLDAHVDADDHGAAGALRRAHLHHVGDGDLAVVRRARSPPAPSPSRSA